MGYSLTLDIPEKIYQSLLKTANQTGQKPEVLAVQCLSKITLEQESDPLEKFIGAFKSNIPDWADEHDHYLGRSILNKPEEH
jgi:hypothetical protein